MGRRWLLVDVGNCRVKWGWVENGGPLLAGTPFPSDPARLPDELTRHWAGLERPDAVHVANVGERTGRPCWVPGPAVTGTSRRASSRFRPRP